MKKNRVYIVAIISKMLTVSMSLFTAALINRALGVELKGEYAYIVNFESILVVLFSFGLGQTYSSYHKKYGDKYLGFFVFLSILHFAICLILFLISLILKNVNLSLTLLITSFATLRTNLLYFAAIEDIKKRDILNVFYKIIYSSLVLFCFILFKKNLIIMLILLVIDDLVICFGTFKAFNLFKFLKNKNIEDKTFIKKLYRLALTTTLMLLMMSLNYNIDVLLLKKFSSAYSVGIYSVGIQLANMVWLIPDAFKDVLFHKNSKKDSVEDILFSIKFNIYFNIIIIIGFIFLGKPFIIFIYGKEYVQSYIISIILFIGCISMVIYKMIHPIYISNGKQKIVLYILIFSVLLNIILNIIFIPKYDIIGAAVSSVFSYTLCSLIFIIIFSKDYNVSFWDFFIIRKSELKKLKVGKKNVNS